MLSRHLFIQNLPWNINSNNLEVIFSPFGQVEHWKVSKTDRQNNCRHAFILYKHVSDAKKAMLHLNGSIVYNKIIRVSIAQRQNYREMILQVSNLPTSITQRRLNDLFESHGGRTIQLLPNGKAYIKFPLRRQAFNAMKDFFGYIIPGYPNSVPLFINYTTSNVYVSAEEIPSICIHNLPSEVTCDDIYRMFSRYGTVSEVDGVKDEHTNFLKYAFVHMSLYHQACNAIAQLNGSLFGTNKLNVKFQQIL